MTIIRVFPRRTSLTPGDGLVFIGAPPELPPPPAADEVHVSVTFTWDMEEGRRLAEAWRQYHPCVSLGGPAFGSPCAESPPGRYLRPGVMVTSRGCNYHCPWCLVPVREGRLRPVQWRPGSIVQDNNLLQNDRAHVAAVLDSIRHIGRIEFTGGLDARLLTTEHADAIRALRLRHLFLACDAESALAPLRRAVRRLDGLDRWQIRCYVLLAYGGQTFSDAVGILEDVWGAGAMPYAILYQPPDGWIDYDADWRHLATAWCRPALMAAAHRD